MTNDTTHKFHDTYQARANDIAKLMDILQVELDKDMQDLGTVGDMRKIRSGLIEMISFTSGFTHAYIEKLLADK